MSPDLIGVLTSAIGVGLFCLGLLQGGKPFWPAVGAVLLAGGLLIIAFS